MLPQESIGIDLTPERVDIAYLKGSPRSVRVAAWERHAVDARSPRNEQIRTIAAHIREFIFRHRLASVGIHLGLPAEKIILRRIALPTAVAENLTETLQYEIEKYVPLPAEEIRIAHRIMGVDKERKQLDLLLVTTRRKEIDDYLSLINQLEANVCAIEPTVVGMADLMNFIDPEGFKANPILMHPRSGQLEIIGIKGGQADFVRLIPLDSQAPSLEQQIADAFRPLAGPATDDAPARAVWVLGESRAEGTVASLDAALDNTFRFKEVDGGPAGWEAAAGAAALAFRGVRNAEPEINFLPEELRRKPSRAGRYLTVALLLLALAAGAVWVGSHILHGRMVVNRLDREIARLEQEIKDIEKLEAQIETLGQRKAYLENLGQTSLPALEVLRELSRILPNTAWIRAFNLTGGKTQIDGFADTASDLIPLLDASPMFTNVGFLSVITKGRDGKEKFKIGFEVLLPPS